MRLRRKPDTKLRGIKRTSKRLADGSVKVFLYHRATGLPLDPGNLVESYAAAEKRKRPAARRRCRTSYGFSTARRPTPSSAKRRAINIRGS
ncbi:hypothetical protein SAMN05216525_10860 [Bradyrhizobium sp. Gha]|nr:hypothetical protein SAMN05216525_10860 [Bradyrhizobium sp. Gha]